MDSLMKFGGCNCTIIAYPPASAVQKAITITKGSGVRPYFLHT